MTPDQLTQAVRAAVVPGFRDGLLAKGQARSLIWRDGILPSGAPNFPRSLTYDLLSYAYSLLLMGIRLRESFAEEADIRRAFEQAGNALESVIKNGDRDDPAHGFHRVLAGAAFHLGRYSARAFSLLSVSLQSQNVTPCEQALSRLILRSLGTLETQVFESRNSGAAADERLASMLQQASAAEDGESELDSCFEVLDLALTENFLGALGAFVFALETGSEEPVIYAKRLLADGMKVCGEFNLVPQWWCHRLSLHLLDDLWSASFHQVLPSAPHDRSNGTWEESRELFIALLNKRGRSEIELWPSQLEAARRAVDPTDDLVVALPTSSGKTRIAELCILYCLSQGKRVVYVTPLRALSAQVEVSLRGTFVPLGKTVSALYGSIGKSHHDDDVLKARDIVVATPEKLDFALRNDPSLFDDVGLVVLDEGHMIGLGEREVRYEVQVQRLLKRPDSDARRIVCLSAVLPDGDQLDDFVSWLRRDKPGKAVRSVWRPTGLRFGEVVWATDRARLDFRIGDERPFVPAFFVARVPPIGNRKKPFPSDQNELVLATAWRLVEEKQTVLVYCPLKKSVEPFAKRIIDLHKRGALPSVLRHDPWLLRTALSIGAEWLGSEHPILGCLRLGVAIHHGALPTPFRKEIERLLRDGVLTVTVSSPTLAQGLNLTATAIVFSSLHRNREPIPTHEFRNVIGRAGRAFVDGEGLVLFPMFDDLWKRRKQWEGLINDAKARSMESGLLLLVNALLVRLHKALGKPALQDVIEYVANNATAWAFPQINGETAADRQSEERDWERGLAMLDTAILSLIGDEDTEPSEVASKLDEILRSSLWSRRLARLKATPQALFAAALRSRAERIWNNTTAPQRKGYYLAGVGWSTGAKLDAVAEEANALLLKVNGAIILDDHDTAIQAMTSLGELAFGIAPFTPQPYPDNWRDILRAWLSGEPVTNLAEGEVTDVLRFVEDALVYRLPWAIEAMRVRALANAEQVGDISLDDFQITHAVPALETGTLSPSAAILMQAGFASRLAAIKAVEDTGATFSNAREISAWLRSDAVRDLTNGGQWPTEETADLWRTFLEESAPDKARRWTRQTSTHIVQWLDGITPPGPRTLVSVRPKQPGRTTVLSPCFDLIGFLEADLRVDAGLIYGRVSNRDPEVLELTYFGPDNLTAENVR